MDDDNELAQIASAYRELKGMDPKQWNRALNYLADRLAEDDRAAHARKIGWRHPTEWFVGVADTANQYEEANELVAENAEPMEPFEVCGVAVVSQRWAVVVSIVNEDGDMEGEEIAWFDTREDADAYVSGMAHRNG